MGDMDFKMAGTKDGVTALQVIRLYLFCVISNCFTFCFGVETNGACCCMNVVKSCFIIAL